MFPVFFIWEPLRNSKPLFLLNWFLFLIFFSIRAEIIVMMKKINNNKENRHLLKFLFKKKSLILK